MIWVAMRLVASAPAPAAEPAISDPTATATDPAHDMVEIVSVANAVTATVPVVAVTVESSMVAVTLDRQLPWESQGVSSVVMPTKPIRLRARDTPSDPAAPPSPIPAARLKAPMYAVMVGLLVAATVTLLEAVTIPRFTKARTLLVMMLVPSAPAPLRAIPAPLAHAPAMETAAAYAVIVASSNAFTSTLPPVAVTLRFWI